MIQTYDISFLRGFFPLQPLSEFAISYLDTDPNSSVIKQGMMLEHIMKTILRQNNLFNRGYKNEYPSLNEMINIADENELLPTDPGTLQRIDNLRKERNYAVHEFLGDERIARKHIGFILSFSRWFINTWAKHKEFVLYHDGGEGWGVFSLKDDYRLRVSYNPIEMHLPLKPNESVLKYSRRTIQSFKYVE